MGNKMDIKQCRICKKFYDVNSFDRCPHCDGNKKDSVGINNKAGKNESSKGLWDRLKKDREDNVDKTDKVLIHKGFNNNENSNKVFSENFNVNEDNDFKTVQEVNEVIEEKIDCDSDIELTPIIPNENIMVKPDKREFVERMKDDDEMKTVQVYNLTKEPVVGWFVCVKGVCQGESYIIRSGNNKLGRGKDNDIIIEDSTISREQAIIKFEPHKQRFYLLPNNNASKFIYVNGDEVLERICLEPHSHIEIGENVELVFVPFCGENFNWKDYE